MLLGPPCSASAKRPKDSILGQLLPIVFTRIVIKIESSLAMSTARKSTKPARMRVTKVLKAERQAKAIKLKALAELAGAYHASVGFFWIPAPTSTYSPARSHPAPAITTPHTI